MRYAIPALSEGGWIFFSTRIPVIFATENGLLTPKAIISLVCLLSTRAGACFIAGDAFEVQQHGWGRLETGGPIHMGVDKSQFKRRLRCTFGCRSASSLSTAILAKIFVGFDCSWMVFKA